MLPRAIASGKLCAEHAEAVPAVIHTDKTKLQQILFHLVANAIRGKREAAGRARRRQPPAVCGG